MKKAYGADKSFPGVTDVSQDIVEDVNLLLDVIESKHHPFRSVLQLWLIIFAFGVIEMDAWLQLIFLGTSIDQVKCAKVLVLLLK